MRWYKRFICVLTLALVAWVAVSAGIATGEGMAPEVVAPQATEAQAAASEATAPQALFINVGKADCAVFFLAGGTWLVDTGTKDSAEAMLKALDTYGVTELAGVFITHTDKDHVGGLKRLLESGIQVGMLYAPAIHGEKSDEKHDVSKAAEKYEKPMTWLKAGDVIPAGEGTAFTVLGPLVQDMENENNNSLVLHLSTPQGTMLLAGDMEHPAEQALLEAGTLTQVTVLKVGHHGEDDASGVAFLGTVRPEWAIISTNTQEEEDTPDPKVVSLLWQYDVSVAVTQDATCGLLVALQGGMASVEAINYE